MALRRYQPLRSSRGTTWPPEVRSEINARDPWCVGPRVNLPGECEGSSEIDHVRASGALSKKSRSTADNGVRLCSVHHRYKGEHGKAVRPLLLAYLAQWYPEPDSAAMRA